MGFLQTNLGNLSSKESPHVLLSIDGEAPFLPCQIIPQDVEIFFYKKNPRCRSPYGTLPRCSLIAPCHFRFSSCLSDFQIPQSDLSAFQPTQGIAALALGDSCLASAHRNLVTPIYPPSLPAPTPRLSFPSSVCVCFIISLQTSSTFRNMSHLRSCWGGIQP